MTEPIGITPGWRAAVEAAGGQCEGRPRHVRCEHTLSGGHRLYLAADGHVYCENHGPSKPAASALAPIGQQDSLF